MREKLMSLAEYSRYRGVTKPAVGRWRDIGYVILLDGKVDVEASDKLLASRAAVYRGGRATTRPIGNV